MHPVVAYKKVILNRQAQKVVAVAYRRWSFTRGSNCKALTGKVLVFWIGGRTWRFDCTRGKKSIFVECRRRIAGTRSQNTKLYHNRPGESKNRTNFRWGPHDYRIYYVNILTLIQVIRMEFLSLTRRCPSWRNVPNGEERRDTAVFSSQGVLVKSLVFKKASKISTINLKTLIKIFVKVTNNRISTAHYFLTPFIFYCSADSAFIQFYMRV